MKHVFPLSRASLSDSRAALAAVSNSSLMFQTDFYSLLNSLCRFFFFSDECFFFPCLLPWVYFLPVTHFNTATSSVALSLNQIVHSDSEPAL